MVEFYSTFINIHSSKFEQTSFHNDVPQPRCCRGTILLYALLNKHGDAAGLTEKLIQRCNHVIFMKQEINMFYQNHKLSLIFGFT